MTSLTSKIQFINHELHLIIVKHVDDLPARHSDIGLLHVSNGDSAPIGWYIVVAFHSSSWQCRSMSLAFAMPVDDVTAYLLILLLSIHHMSR